MDDYQQQILVFKSSASSRAVIPYLQKFTRKDSEDITLAQEGSSVVPGNIPLQLANTLASLHSCTWKISQTCIILVACMYRLQPMLQ
jgi:hypothetical protein